MRHMRWLILATIGLGLAGCALPPKGPCSPDCRDIKAAMAIDHATERLAVLSTIADRPGLAQPDQIFVVDAILVTGFSSDRADALLSMIKNPACTAETREHIIEKLKQTRLLGVDERRVISALLARRGRDDTTVPPKQQPTEE